MIDSPLYKEFSRVAPTAHVYGFSYEDISFLFKAIKDDEFCREFYGEDKTCEIVLKAILFRLDLNRDTFFNFVSSLETNEYEDIEHLGFLVGKYQVVAFSAMVKAVKSA